MRWQDMRRSENVDDITDGQPAGGGGVPFGGGGLKLGGGAMILVVIVSLLFGVNPLQFLGMMDTGSPTAPAPQPPAAQPGYGPQRTTGPQVTKGAGMLALPIGSDGMSAILDQEQVVFLADVADFIHLRHLPPQMGNDDSPRLFRNVGFE